MGRERERSGRERTRRSPAAPFFSRQRRTLEDVPCTVPENPNVLQISKFCRFARSRSRDKCKLSKRIKEEKKKDCGSAVSETIP